MPRPTPRQRLGYWFDNTMSRGTPALIGWLAAVSIVLVVAISALLVVVDDAQQATAGAAAAEIWKNTVETFKLGDDATRGNWLFRTGVVGLALAGLFFASTLISLLTTGVNNRIEELRKGRSAVLEKGHTVIIGWSDQVFPMISELVEANANQRRGRVAILADRDRAEMEDEIRRVVGRTGRTRVVCRTGSPIDPADLDIVSPQTARSIIVLSPPGGAADAHVTKTLLAITNSPTRRRGPYHIVASVKDTRNRAAARLAGGDETVLVDSDDIAARLIVQTCRQSGLSVVYQDLLDFAGDEIYMQREPALVGRTFGEALHAYPASAVIGVHRADGRVEVRPPMDAVFGEGDEVIAISEDDDTVVTAPWDGEVAEHAIAPPPARAPGPSRTLMLGWNRRAAGIVRQLDAYVTAGSRLDVVADHPDGKTELDEARPALARLEATFTLGDTDTRAALESRDIAGYDHVIVLCYDEDDAQYADGRALITLLHLRQMQAESGQRYAIVSEMSDDRNRRLAQVTRADDFIVSDKLLSLLMVQLSENRHLAGVFDHLFDPDGAEIYLKPAPDYVRPGVPMDFHTVVEAARRRGEVAIGYRVGAQTLAPPTFGVVLNPDKTRRLTFAEDDRIIVLADD
ncbi:CASTOR/POLLUX-related putative ion channel [Actinomadura gamaensis]|uniref:Potassium transporter TrkA n=1 Tax=Actinomadura gamaensis TaxID=1763541 RepID=A0ABV9UAE8_9ACTN